MYIAIHSNKEMKLIECEIKSAFLQEYANYKVSYSLLATNTFIRHVIDFVSAMTLIHLIK